MNAAFESVDFAAADGQMLSGRHFGHPAPSSAVLLCGATGVRQRFYTPFAQWLVEQGHAVLTFDYRGVGDSLHGVHPRAVSARKQHWGELDMPAALSWLAARHPAQPLKLIGHSGGGQLIGLMPNHAQIASVVQVASSSGHVGGIRMPFRMAARGLLAIYVPLTAKLFGYVPAKRIGWGEDLPADVARQWARWCLSPGYVENGFGGEIQRHYYDEFRAPICSISATDDPIATTENIEDLLRLFPNAACERIRLRPSGFGLKSIGHVDLFRPALKAVWPVLGAAVADRRVSL